MSFKAILSAVCAAALALGAVATTEYFERSRFMQEQRADAVRTASVLRAKLEAALNERLHLTDGLGAFGGAGDSVSADSFRLFAEALVPHGVQGVRSLQLAPDAIVKYVYPFKGNEAIIGHNLLADPARREAVERAIKERLFVVAGPLRLIQGGTGLIARQPLFRKGPNGETFWGFATAVLDVEPILDAAGLLSPVDGYQVALRGRDGKGAAGEVFFGEESVFGADPITLDVTLPHGRWQIALVPKGGWGAFGIGSFWILVFGIGMAATIGVAVFTIVREPDRLRQQVQQATAALSESEARYRAVTENANDPILTIGQQGRIVSANAAALSMFKMSPDAMREALFSQLVPEGLERDGDAAILAVTCCRKGGERFEAEASFSDWCSGGECFTTVILRDVSERRRMEDRQAMLRDQFHQAQKMEAVGTLAAGSAHQFNNILNSMLANADAAASALDPNHPAAPLLNAVLDGGWRAADIVRRLLAFSQSNGGDHHPVDVVDLVRRTVEHWQAESAAPVKVEMDSQQPQVFAEETQLEQALVALLENASDALPEGNGAIRVKVGVEVVEEDRLCDNCRHLSSTLPRGVYAAIAVEDDGAGIPTTELRRIFEPFYTTKAVDQGAGLGLFVVSGTARGFGGSVAVESEMGRGSRFTLLLPCVQH